MTGIRGPLAQLGFTHISMDMAGCHSIAGLFPNKSERCGIYVLHFDNGEFYVGKSIDLVKRYAQHRLVFRDIASLSFKPTPTDELGSAEVHVVKTLEDLEVHLRNKQIVQFSYGSTGLGDLFTTDDLLWWCSDSNNTFVEVVRTDNEKQRWLYAQELDNIQLLEHFEDAVSVASEFVRNTIPAPNATEARFWSVTRPSRSTKVILRANVGAQQTLAIVNERNRLPLYCFYLPWQFVSEFSSARSRYVEGKRDQIVVGGSQASYPVVFGGQRAGGFNEQVVFEIQSPEQALHMIYTDELLLAWRKFHVALMQKGTCMWEANHIYALADRLLESPED